MEHGDRVAVGFEEGPEVLEGPQVLGEDDRLVVELRQELAEAAGLLVLPDRGRATIKVRERPPVPVREVRALLHPPQGLRGRERAAPHLLLEDREGETVHARRPAAVRRVPVPDEVRDRLVQFPLRAGEGDLRREHPPRREDEDRAPPVPDHHLAQETLQLPRVRRGAGVPAPDEPALEAPVRTQVAGPQEGHEVEQLLEVVLDRRRREEEHVLLPDRGDEFPVLRRTVLQLVGLVHDHDVVRETLDLLPVDVPLRGVDRRDHAVVAGPVLDLVHDLEVEAELRLHLLLPLRDEGRGGEDEDLPGEPADDELLQDDPRLDRLPEADLVREDRAPPHDSQDPQGGLHLVIVVPHAPDEGKGQEDVEPGLEPQQSRLVVEDPIRRVLHDPVLDLREDLRVVRGEREARDPIGRIREPREHLGPRTRGRCGGRAFPGPLRGGRRGGQLRPEDREPPAGLAVPSVALGLPEVRGDEAPQERLHAGREGCVQGLPPHPEAPRLIQGEPPVVVEDAVPLRLAREVDELPTLERGGEGNGAEDSAGRG